MTDALQPVAACTLPGASRVASTQVDPARARLIVDDRRRLGAYYTSEHVAKALVKWALDGRPGTVLDPSYGGCAFLRVALDHLRNLGASRPAELVYGTDIDQATARWRAHLVGQGVPESQLLSADFLQTHHGIDMPLCRAVVGNPPYIRHHWISREQMQAYGPLRDKYGLSARASTWAYFVLHALSFVEPGGRIAFLLPGAVLHDGYATAVRGALAKTCESVAFVRLRERLFEEAQEETVVLLAQVAQHADEENIDPSKTHLAYLDVDNVAELARLLDSWPPHTNRTEHSLALAQPDKAVSLPVEAKDLLKRFWDTGLLRPLKDIAELRIGVVTGANSFFVRGLSDVPDDQSVTTRPIISRSIWLDRPMWTDYDVERLTRQDLKTQLIVIDPVWRHEFSAGDRTSDLNLQVEQAQIEGIHERHYCAKRNPWYTLTDTRVPDAFLPYMGRIVPRPVMNNSKATCTNAIHRLTWLDDPSPERAFGRILSGWSSLWQAFGEIAGRHYGGGVLKLEPRAAGNLPFLDPDPSDPAIFRILETARDASSRGSRSEIFDAADSLVAHYLSLDATEISLLASAAHSLRLNRPRSGA